ncbi:hypothetical protein BsWGS_22434 [Bradybaena similaris]
MPHDNGGSCIPVGLLDLTAWDRQCNNKYYSSSSSSSSSPLTNGVVVHGSPQISVLVFWISIVDDIPPCQHLNSLSIISLCQPVSVLSQISPTIPMLSSFSFLNT